MKHYLNENSMKKKTLRKALGAISDLAGVKIKKRMLKRFNSTESDELVMTPVAVKSVLGQMGYRITSLEVREGDSAVFAKNRWKVTSDVANHTNKLIGIFTILTGENENISNFTPISYIDKVKDIGGDSWEDWYDENAKSAALRHTLKASTIAFLAKPILSKSKGSHEETPIKNDTEFASLVEQLMVQVGETFTGKEEQKAEDTLEIPEVIIPIVKASTSENNIGTVTNERLPEATEEEKSPIKEVTSEEVLIEETPAEKAEPKEIPAPVLKNLSRKNWMTARDEIEKRFHDGESKESLQEDVDKLEKVKPRGIKDEKIVLDEIIHEKEVTSEDKEEVDVDRQSDVAEEHNEVSIEPEPTPKPKETDSIEEIDMSTPFDAVVTDQKPTNGITVDEWVKKHRELDKRWQDGEFGEEMNNEAKSLLEIKPSAVSGTILTENSFLVSKEEKDKEGEAWRASVKEWKEWKSDIEYRWREGQEQIEIDAEVKELNSSIPNGFGAGVVKVGKAWENERVKPKVVKEEPIQSPTPNVVQSEKEVPPIPSSSGLTPKTFVGSYDEPMSVREWMGAYGTLERRRKEEGRNWELFHSAEIIERRRPEQIKAGMLDMSKYEVTGEEG